MPSSRFHWPLRAALITLLAPFLMADSCVKAVYVLYEYQLDACPPADFELAQATSFGGWSLRAEEGSPYCHGFLRYRLDEIKEPEIFDEPVKGALVYAKLRNRAPGDCRLQLISSLACNPRESIDECEKRMHYGGAHPALKSRVRDYTDIVATKLVLGQKFAPRVPAMTSTKIGRTDLLERWCEKN